MDFFREDTLYFGFSLGQWFSLVMVVVAGYMLVDMQADLWDGSFHEVDSSEAAFKMAGSLRKSS